MDGFVILPRFLAPERDQAFMEQVGDLWLQRRRTDNPRLIAMRLRTDPKIGLYRAGIASGSA